MGANANYAGQPVVRRVLTDASAASSEMTSDQQALARKQDEKRRREADRVAMDDGELFERIVDALEQRVLDELERRGRRHSPGVF